MSEFLSPPELHSLTGFVRFAAQVEWLKNHGIPHRTDARRVIVSRNHVRAWLEGRQVVTSSGPNWSAIRA